MVSASFFLGISSLKPYQTIVLVSSYVLSLRVCVHVSDIPELRSRPGLKARLLTVGESLSQQMVLETLVLKFPSNLNTHKDRAHCEVNGVYPAHLLVEQFRGFSQHSDLLLHSFILQ